MKHDVVLLGDTFEFWIREPAYTLIRYAKEVEMIREIMAPSKLRYRNGNIYYVWGNHDWHMSALPQDLWPGQETCQIDQYIFTHGFQFENREMYIAADKILYHLDEGTTGWLYKLWQWWAGRTKKKFIKPPGERLAEADHQGIWEAARDRQLDNKDDRWVIYGHTHRPFIDHENRIANAGTWLNGTYMEIDEDGPKLKEWRDE
jgi:predicted phosphodiesterase